MGIIELNTSSKQLFLFSNILLYGNAINEAIRKDMEEEIATMWNAPNGKVNLDGEIYTINFMINCWLNPTLTQLDILENVNPKNNYIRVETTSSINISFVDGLGSNTGYFFLENLYKGSTTAAHEYGHTLGLDHPINMDIRGNGTPGIMYPRGTLVDAQFQYNPSAISGDSTNGGTMHPMHRKVLQLDIDNLKINKLRFQNGKTVIGDYSSVWHEKH
jgi:hypothetical protein